MGYFVTFEGVEGCGKTTQVKLLSKFLTARGHHTLLTREPGGCSLADKIRSILLDAETRALSALAELYLYAAARAQHVSEIIAPALEAGQIVLCDRFCDSTVAYQGYGRGIDLSIIDSLNFQACQGVLPNLTVLLDCDPRVGLERANSRINTGCGPREERFELEALAFHQRVHIGFQKLAVAEPGRFLVVDGSDTVETVFSAISRKVLTRIPEASNVV
jgi:dTMP kinase